MGAERSCGPPQNMNEGVRGVTAGVTGGGRSDTQQTAQTAASVCV